MTDVEMLARPMTCIQSLVCEEFGVTLMELLSARRAKHLARPRQIGMWLAKHTTLYSFPAIGMYFGKRDHTTVMHAIKVIDGLVARGDGYGRAAAILLNRLRDDPRQADLLTSPIGAVSP